MSTHGMSKIPEYRVWTSMRSRCSNPNVMEYRDYGGRGIQVCERWGTFENFIADMGRRPSPKHSIERDDNNGDYEVGNCRWATAKEQARNRRRRQELAPKGMLPPAQLRAARVLVAWSRQDLAKHSGTSPDTVQGFENRGTDPKLSTLGKWRRALERAGVVFIDPDYDMGPGIRLRTGAKQR